MSYNRNILHPTEEDYEGSGLYYYSEFYHQRCKVGYLYDKWLKILNDGGLKFDKVADILKFNDRSRVYTPYTYKINFNFPLSNPNIIDNYKLQDSQYELFAKLFFTEGWQEELKESFDTEHSHKKYEYKNYGDVCIHTKSWVDYVTFQGSRIIIQFRFDDYLKTEGRKEKIKYLETV